MGKITKIFTDEPTNFQGYTLNEDGVPVFDELQIGNVELKAQTDGTIVVTDKITGNVKTTLEINRESEQAVTKVFSSEIVEDSTTAFQPVDTDTVVASTFDTGREQWQMQFDLQADSNRHTVAYRGKSTTGLDNVRVLIYSLTNEDPATNLEETEYNELIAGQWWTSKNHIWSTRKKREVVDERVRKEDTDYTSPFDLVPDVDDYVSIDVDVTFETGKYYRVLVCADNQFDLRGLDNTVEDPVNGGTQFFLYVERTYQNITNLTSQSNVVKFTPTDTVNFERDATDTTIIVDNGDEFAVNAIKAVNVDGTISIVTKLANRPIYTDINHENVTIVGLNPYNSINTVIDALNALFEVTPLGLGGEYVSTIPTSAGVAITGNFAEGQDPIGDSIYGVGSDTSQHGARIWSTETIDETGEFFEVKIVGEGQFMLGVYDANSDDLTQITNNVGDGHSGYKWANAFYKYPYGISPWTFYGSNSLGVPKEGWNGSADEQMRYNGTVQSNFVNTNPANPVLFKVGINHEGRVIVWYFDEGRSNQYIMTARSHYTLHEGQYGLLVKLVNGTTQLVELPTRSAVDPVAPILTYHYVESPDDNFEYPLFATAEEANYVDTLNGGGGTSLEKIITDDSVLGRIWHIPNTGFTTNGTTAPTNTSEITYNEIITLPDADFRPPLFPSQTVTIDELSSLNLQVHPTGSTGFTTSVGTIPQFSLDNTGVYLQGTAPEVTGDYIANPYDEYTATIYRTNSYGTSPNPTELANGEGVLTIRINNLTAPVITPITGFAHNASSTALVDSDTLGDGSVIELDETLGDIQRLVILQSYVETYILPNLTTTGDKYIIGNLNAAADVSSLEESVYDFAIVWEYVAGNNHKYKFVRDGVVIKEQIISSSSDAFFDYGIEVQGSDVWLIGCNVNAINAQISPSYVSDPSTLFTNVEKVETIDNSAPLTISVGSIGSNSKFGTTGLSEIVVPRPSTWIQVVSDTPFDFDGAATMPTLQAGYTYRFLMGDVEYDDQTTGTGLSSGQDLRFTSDGSTEYTTGITRVGTVGDSGSYIEFVVPSDVPPLWYYKDSDGISQDNGVSISGSSYVAPVTGITLEGSNGSQTPPNLFDTGSYGWASIDETLSAGERLVLDGAFLNDLASAMPDKSYVYFGVKDTSFSLGNSLNSMEGYIALSIYRDTVSSVQIRIALNGSLGTSTSTYYTTVAGIANWVAFIEITSLGNNIRMGAGFASYYNVNTTTYADWGGPKAQTGNQGYGITSRDIVIFGEAVTGNSSGMSTADVDWTGLNEVSVPQPPVTNDTNWNKALDFSGSSERAQQVNSNSNYMPIAMDGLSATVTGHATAGYTSGHIYSRPFAGAIVFRSDGNNSNQHLFNQGEGAGGNDDNIYVRVTSTNQVYFGWGRDGALNECYLGNISANTWYGLYFAHTGERLSGNNATANNLADCFDFRWITISSGAVHNNISQASNWTSTGGRMDRSVVGNFTIGGRGANRNFHGKVASMVVTTLRINQPMPDATEIGVMVTDPIKWLNDYKDGNTYRVASSQAEATFGLFNYLSNSAFATQVWLMGDGTMDSYSNMIRNQVYQNDQNYTKLNLISMVSNDIENVTINGLT